MTIQAEGLEVLVESLEALLDRFEQSHSIRVEDRIPPYIDKSNKGKATRDVLTYSIPKPAKVKEIKEYWKKDRRLMPKSGIVFPDGSLMTVLFVCKSLPVPEMLQPVERFRYATGPILEFDKILSGCEKVLAAKQRADRLTKWFNEGKFEALLMDMTVEGVVNFYDSLEKAAQKKLTRNDEYDAFLAKYVG